MKAKLYMTPKRIEVLQAEFTQACIRLKELVVKDDSETDYLVDALIQRFEFSFELAWKYLKHILEFRGITANSPRIVIKEAYREKLIHDGDAWLSMLDDRNSSAHIYDQSLSKKIGNSIRTKHYALLHDLTKLTP
jgi:nucleotidyltransferase substrate binding protein (TIGR01987 family)